MLYDKKLYVFCVTVGQVNSHNERSRSWWGLQARYYLQNYWTDFLPSQNDTVININDTVININDIKIKIVKINAWK